jgi:acylphosphatase
VLRYKIKVTGRVQGVFFRVKAREEALRLRLTGLARNDPDGSVYIEVEGAELDLKKFLQWCHVGPELAEVTEVTFETSEPMGYKTFETE